MTFETKTASCRVDPMKFDTKQALVALKKLGYPKATLVKKPKPKPEPKPTS